MEIAHHNTDYLGQLIFLEQHRTEILRTVYSNENDAKNVSVSFYIDYF